MTKRTPPSPGRAHAGFSLFEIVIVLAILGILTAGIAIPISTQVQMRRYEDTRKLMADAKDALLGFAAANGRLPCPASSTSNGLESFAVGGSAANGNCSNFYDGFLPGAALGLSPLDSSGYVPDAWNNRARYAVANWAGGAPINNPLTTTNGVQLTTMATMSTRTFLYICASGTGVTATTCGPAANQMTNMAPFAIISLGPNGAAAATSTDETKNTDGNIVFVMHEPAPASTGNEFDDIVTWASLNTLFSRLIAGGKVP